MDYFCRFVLMVSFSRSFLHHLGQVDNYPYGAYICKCLTLCHIRLENLFNYDFLNYLKT